MSDSHPTSRWRIGERRLAVLFFVFFAGSLGFSGCQGSDISVGAIPLTASQDTIGAELGDPLQPNPTCYADSDCGALISSPCARAVCNPTTKRCEASTLPDFVACQGGGPCAAEAACFSGVCVPLKRDTCDDSNPCTSDDCDPQLGCVHKDTSVAPCSDGNPCTIGDRCVGGGCKALDNLCACKQDADCAASGDLCLGKLICSEGACVVDAASAVDCDDDNPCTQDECVGATGACSHTPLADNSPCDDGDICTQQERCVQGACAATAKLPCDGADGMCPTKVCDPKAGCVPTGDGQPCDDGNACTKNDRCQTGVCGGTSTCECSEDADCADVTDVPACMGQVACRAGRCEVNPNVAVPCPPSSLACVINRCTPKGCQVEKAPPGAICDDGTACTWGDVCNNAGNCQPGQALPCDDGLACTNDACIPSVGCVHGPGADGKPCDDGLSCTTGDVCVGLSCEGKPTGCDDGDACTTDFCAPSGKGCVHKPLAEGAACDDDDPCTVGERCTAGACSPIKVVDCDDGDVCSEDVCDGFGGCDHPAIPGEKLCDDGDVCTTNDACKGGKCVGEDGGCACKTHADCAALEDGDLCNGTLICSDHTCVVDPATMVTCTDSVSPCVAVTCQPNTGLCVEKAAALGESCDDGDVCTKAERCLVGGACGGGAAVDCDDGDACTVDSCDSGSAGAGGKPGQPGKGCVHTPAAAALGVPCDDGNPCTQGDVCDVGGCKAGKNTCQCSKDADCVAFDDDDLCNGVLRCNKGACVPDGQVVTCDPSKGGPCVDVACQPKTGQCAAVAMADGVTCTLPAAPGGGAGGASACGVAGLCQGGSCKPSGAPVCDDGNPCTADSCGATGQCVHQAQTGQSCDDGDACTQGEVCGADGTCGGGKDACSCKVAADCPDDGDLCNGVPACVAGACQVKVGSAVICDTSKDGPCQQTSCQPKTGLCKATLQPTGKACDDGDACTQGESCGAGTCAGGGAVSCDDGNACTDDGCNPAKGCYHTFSTKGCDDGDPCTLGDTCAQGACVPGSGTCTCVTNADCAKQDDGNACNGVLFCETGSCKIKPNSVVICDDSNDTNCAANLCDQQTGACQMTPFPEGTACDDNNICSVKDQCVGGKCAGTVASCDDGNPCSDDSCDPKTGCKNTANTASCEDGNPCTSGDVCAGGSCTAGKDTCGGCSNDSDCAKQDDGDPCNGTLTCQAGTCAPTPVVVCKDDGNPCTTAACDAKTGGCVTTLVANGAPCDDGDVCTTESACSAGVCLGKGKKDCDDGEVCTNDSCDKSKGCQHAAAIAKPCDDGNACTAPDLCGPQGTCQGGANTCQCKSDGDCKALEDGDLCNGVLVCSKNQCVVKAGSVVVCDSSKDTSCRSNVCAPKTGVCGLQSKADGSACTDGTVCTSGDACAGGLCKGKLVSCDDGDVCTLDSCDAKLGCSHTPQDGASCDDGNVCTTGDACKGGSCMGGANVCQCKSDADCKALEDGDLCNGTLRCQSNLCVVDPKTVVTCTGAGDACADVACSPKTGACSKTPKPNGSACPDGDACTTGELCFAGSCVKQAVKCDDNNVCTTDSCDAKKGCVHKNATGINTCDDGDPCTPISVCQGGKCVGPINTCFCQTNSDCKDDGDKCNGVPTCQGGRCRVAPGSVVTCDPSKDGPCEASQCVPATGTCAKLPKPVGTSCDDGSACTAGDVCTLGTCVGIPFGCDDKISCTIDTCDAKKGCVSTPNAGACDDGNACTTDSCDPKAGCKNIANTAPCDDGDACTEGDTCQGGTCVSGPKGALCCVVGKPCDDGDACTGKDTCVKGTCGGAPLSCDDGNACTDDSCNKTTGCVHKNNTAACNDGDPCTLQDTCAAGVCVGKIAFTCDDGNVCTADSCGPLGCKSVPKSGPCSDGNACTEGDSCQGGACVSKPKSCDDGNGCTTDFCDQTAGCKTVPNAAACSDGSLCTSGDTCSGGACVGKAVSCDDNNPCTQDVCAATSGCSNSAVKDGTACGTSGVCLAGACSVGSDLNPALSCKEVQTKVPGAKSGMYYLDPDGSGPGQKYQAKCDMSSYGGGWMVLDVAEINRLMTMSSLVNGGMCTLSSSEWRTWDQFNGSTADHHFCVAEPKTGLVWPTYTELRVEGVQLVGYTGGGNNTFDAYTDCYGASWQGNFCVGPSLELKSMNSSNIQLKNGQASPVYFRSFVLSKPRNEFQVRTREEGPQLEGVSWKTGAILLR